MEPWRFNRLFAALLWVAAALAVASGIATAAAPIAAPAAPAAAPSAPAVAPSALPAVAPATPAVAPATPAAAPAALPAATSVAEKPLWIGEGTPYATQYYVINSGKPGPTVLIVGGVHGNEPAGAAAAEEIRHLTIACGKLVVLPQANRLALAAAIRLMPSTGGAAAAGGENDLNRCFPPSPNEAPKGPLAAAIWKMVEGVRPDWLLDLHEGSGVRAAGSKSVGSSIIRIPHPETAAIQDLMLAAVNATVAAEKRFTPLHGGANGSLARAGGERLGARAFIVETTSKDQPLALRIRQHRIMVYTLLKRLGMLAGDASGMVPQARLTPAAVYAAVYDGLGASSTTTPPRFERILTPAADVLLRRVTPEDIRDGALARF